MADGGIGDDRKCTPSVIQHVCHFFETHGIQMKLLISHQTRAGTFYIGQSRDGRFHPVYNDEDYGSYVSAAQAIDDLRNNATFSISHKDTGQSLDTSTLGLPESPSEWTRV